MNVLHDLRPAEIQMVMSPLGTKMREFMKLTYLDLELRGVLKTQFEERQSGRNGTVRTIPYVYVGQQFKKGHAFPHEAWILSPFQERQNIRYQLRNFMIAAMQNVKSERKFKRRQLMESSRLRPYFKQNWFQKINGNFTLNKQGEALKQQVEDALKNKAKELEQLEQSNPKQFATEIEKLKGNVLLLDAYSEKILPRIKQVLSTINIGQLAQNFVESWVYFDLMEESMYSVFDAVEVSMGCSSGCGGDSGCSGCGGCGGCGGCS